MRDSYSSITRLPEKSDEYGLMHVMAVKGSKNSYSLPFDLSNTRHLIECIFGIILRFGTSLLLIVLYNEKVKHKEEFSLLYFGLLETNITE